MRNNLLIIILIGFFSVAQAQTFKGTVYDRSTDSTLCSALIYISGTSTGTYSDIHGNFTLDISQNSTMPITISLLGYYSVTLSEHNSNKMHNIYLSPKIVELNEFVVTAKANVNRKTYLRIFKREFLGETENASWCDILNERDLRFSYNRDSSELSAFSSEPILIKNNALGYTITYYLDKFRYSRSSDEKRVLTEKFCMLGSYLFTDDLLTFSESEKKIVEERRKKAYLGSRMHFFRLLFGGELIQTDKYSILLSDKSHISSGFSIGSKSIINSDLLVIRKDSVSGCIKNKGELSVRFRMRDSKLDAKMDSVYFEKNGYFDPVEISFSGVMAKQRIGDLLPFEYMLK